MSASTDHGDIISEVWFEVALCQLLQLTDIPFLEDILAPPLTDGSMGVIVISNNVPDPCIQGSDHKENVNRSESSCVWVTAGMDCIQLQTDFPLPQQAETGYLNVMNVKEAGIQQILLEYYGSLLDSLITSNLTDLVDGMLCALGNDWSKTVTCLPLLALMLPVSQRKHLRKLLNFMERSMHTSSGRFIVKKFTGAILPKDIQNKVGVPVLYCWEYYGTSLFDTFRVTPSINSKSLLMSKESLHCNIKLTYDQAQFSFRLEKIYPFLGRCNMIYVCRCKNKAWKKALFLFRSWNIWFHIFTLLWFLMLH